MIAGGDTGVMRTPLRTLLGGGGGGGRGNLLSPMLEARMLDLGHDMCRDGSSSNNNNRRRGSCDGERRDKSTPGGRSSLQAALGLLSPIEHHHHGDHVPKKTL